MINLQIKHQILVLYVIKFLDWILSVSEEYLATQTLEYWLLSFVNIASADADYWDKEVRSYDWLLHCFEITLETSIAIVSRVSENYLKQQSPRYWVETWIIQKSNDASPEFMSFIENANENEIVNYKDELHPTPIHVVNKIPVSGVDNELKFLLQTTDLGKQANESTLFYHTTNLYSAENIITQGIAFGKCREKQDFGGRDGSYYLNDKFEYAVEFGRYRFLNDTCVVIVYHIPVSLLDQYSHLDLSEDNKNWKEVVCSSRSGLKCIADDYDSVYGPQATNGTNLLNDVHSTPKESTYKNQLAVKTRKLSKRIDKQIVGVIIYNNKK